MSVYAQRVASDGPAAWWPLVLPAGSSSVPDQSGNGYTASPTAVTFGYADTPVAGEPWSASFNGSAYADATSFNPSAWPACTVEGWVNLLGRHQGTANPRLLANSHTDGTNDNSGFELFISSVTTAQVAFGNSTANSTLSAAGSFGTGWQYLAGTWDGSVTTLYVNGAIAATGTLTGALAPGITGYTSLGYNAVYGHDWVNGLLAHLAVYDKALTAAQIAAHYAAAAVPPGLFLGLF